MFLRPIAGVMVVDYWVVRRKKVNIEELYKDRGVYYYQGGVLWAGVGSFIIGVRRICGWPFPRRIFCAFGIPLLGLELAWYYGFIISGAIYYLWAMVNKKQVLVDQGLQ